jgi:hypothetical protein
MTTIIRLVSIVFLFFGICSARATISAASDPDAGLAVTVSATFSTSPYTISLHFGGQPNSGGTIASYNIYRKSKSATAWTLLTTLAGTATDYPDPTVTTGDGFEYRVQRNFSSGASVNGYVYTGINLPLSASSMENRGILLLLVEQTQGALLSTEIATLTDDLVGDGWQVIRRDVQTSHSVSYVKSVIRSIWNSQGSNFKAIFILGHVAVPYSGYSAWDNHSNHEGAWPTDGYYGSMASDGQFGWTDSWVNTTANSRNVNTPGDGRFDQIHFPSAPELMVGRVDMHDLAADPTPDGWSDFLLRGANHNALETVTQAETRLLRNYLNKDHKYRNAQAGYTFYRRGFKQCYLGTGAADSF